MPAKTDPINTSNPAGDSDPKQGDDYIRTLAKALIELLTVDHYVGVANPWGNDASGDETGEHAKVMFHEAISDPSVAAGKGVLFIKGSPPELYFRDEDDGNVIQLTNGGIVNLTSAALLGILANDAYFTGVDEAGTGTVNLIKVGTNDLATLPDSAEMASNAAPVEDEAIANKKYVDDNEAATKYSINPMTGGNDSDGTITFPNGLIWKWGKTTISNDGDNTITFPVPAFPNACFSVIASSGDPTEATYDYQALIHTIVAASFKYRVRLANRHSPCRWFAVGR